VEGEGGVYYFHVDGHVWGGGGYCVSILIINSIGSHNHVYAKRMASERESNCWDSSPPSNIRRLPNIPAA